MKYVAASSGSMRSLRNPLDSREARRFRTGPPSAVLAGRGRKSDDIASMTHGGAGVERYGQKERALSVPPDLADGKGPAKSSYGLRKTIVRAGSGRPGT